MARICDINVRCVIFHGSVIVIFIVINKHIWCNNLDLSTIDYSELVNEGCCSL
jgi:hypothetical protein